ncbi:MAG: DEAD/DEAH box helicase, partial [Firmicutes bacterium]|nr:DEAD/DEAH box helicase [Bacillota bacterium]
VFYNYKHERTRIEKLFPQTRHISEDGTVEDWNAGKIPILLANPASAGHGLNLQVGGHIIVWFSPTWNLEYYEQANKRLHRRGQTKPVIVQHLIAKGTLDEVILHDVLRQKKKLQDALLGAVRATVEVRT